ncbi:DUF4145 domain-containing protein [Mycobacterium sp. SMC-17]|uniref:DUF4145 domain-containing protein n=1 Tax=Mycobacterium sp. SMC-17 TaxID=3381628 RepID=UPI003875C680
MASEQIRFEADNEADAVEVERNPDTLPTSVDSSGTCGRCGRIAQFTHVHTVVLKRRTAFAVGAVERAVVLQCQGCLDSIVVIELFADRAAKGLYWWPMPGFEAQAEAGVPKDVADAYNEGSRCIAVDAPNAAVAMFRTAIAQIVSDKGSATAKAEKDLYRRIEKMAEEGALFQSFGGWAHHIRKVGNAGAHGEAFEPVATDDATELQRFVGQLIDFLYVQPARLAAAMGPVKRTSS